MRKSVLALPQRVPHLEFTERYAFAVIVKFLKSCCYTSDPPEEMAALSLAITSCSILRQHMHPEQHEGTGRISGSV